MITEEYLKNSLILDSGYSVDIFINPWLVIDSNRVNQVIHLSTYVGYKINQI